MTQNGISTKCSILLKRKTNRSLFSNCWHPFYAFRVDEAICTSNLVHRLSMFCSSLQVKN